MSELTRRAAIGSVAASALAGLSSKALGGQSDNREIPQTARSLDLQTVDGQDDVKTMSLDEFRRQNGPVATEELFSHIEGKSFSMCHRQMREEHGIWIPELVPVFEKMDAMRAAKRT